MKDLYQEAAHKVALDHVSETFHRWDELDVTLVRNALLDCIFSADEPDFIARVTDHRVFRTRARRVFDRIKPDLVPLTGRLVQELRLEAV